MLANATLKAFVPTMMPARAKIFYRDILGFKFLHEDNYALEFDANGILLRVSIVPELKPHPFTILGWNVADIAATIQSLNKKGIAFEKYPFLEQDKTGVWTSPNGSKVAWFKDPDGNILSLTEL
jgi:predicted enzyme related to lactoylglutathione lyase